MIEEAYISFEIAKLLKAKGFDVDCHGYYDTTKHPDYILEHSASEMNSNDGPDCYLSAPTQQMVLRWLREVHSIFMCIAPVHHIFDNIINYEWQVYNKNYDVVGDSEIFFKTYEEGVEDAIKYCLENLID